MGFRRRMFDFKGDDSAYSHYLEAKVLELQEQLRQVSNSVPPLSAPQSSSLSPPSSSSSSLPQPSLSLLPPALCPQSSSLRPSPARSIATEGAPRRSSDDEFIWNSRPPPVKKSRLSEPRWKREIDKMLKGIPTAQQWDDKRRNLNLSSWDDVLLAFDLIIDRDNTLLATKRVIRETDSLASFDQADDEADNRAASPLLISARAYARRTVALNAEGRFTTHVLQFRELVLISLCIALISDGIDTTVVNSVMKIFITDSEDERYLQRVRDGALWVNNIISKLVNTGLGHRASEIFVLCSQSVVRYYRFAQSRKESSHLSSICTSLGYSKDHISRKYDYFYRNYIARQLQWRFASSCDGLGADLIETALDRLTAVADIVLTSEQRSQTSAIVATDEDSEPVSLRESQNQLNANPFDLPLVVEPRNDQPEPFVPDQQIPRRDLLAGLSGSPLAQNQVHTQGPGSRTIDDSRDDSQDTEQFYCQPNDTDLASFFVNSDLSNYFHF
ncbi:hypothetical protein OIDMADRAFT_61455 [Oidiodendron maius Zn]|uniref:Uncharacterized protein n=1 Tax=Oidiodendron maius (strain Zn) TaxID=913774 RepID=A0A0C3CUX8_OIDMZ|nr:hypothetical protein OIDMADRAFT_61455 [Oidiodendron maius Zn]